jgi:hypothetical protein
LIKEFTFETEFVSLTHAEGRLLTAYRDYQRNLLQRADAKAREKNPQHA